MQAPNTRRLRQLPVVLLGATLISSCASSGVSVSDVAGVLGGGTSSSAGVLSSTEIVSGLKEALAKGSRAVVGQLGKPGGFSDDPIAYIPLPDSLTKAADFGRKVGLGSYFDDLELRLNEAAEQATPKAQALFIGAIDNMSIADARGILSGPDDAATRYFEKQTGDSLTSEMSPIVDGALADVGAVASFNTLVAKVNAVPLAPQIDTDLTGYVTEKAKDGIFSYLADEEKAIRDNPLERTSEILQRVFGS